MNVSNFLGELKRRNVYRVAVTYAVFTWLLIQVATQVSPYFAVPNWSVRVLILLLVVCFPVTLTLAWAFELTPEGFKRTEDVPRHKSIRHHTGRKLIALSMVLAAVALGMWLIRSAGLRTFLETSNENASAAAENVVLHVPEKSIAVLPFANLSDDKENAYFTDGVQDEILGRIARLADLKVISRTSTQVYRSGMPRNLRAIGRELGVRHIIEGSVQRVQSRVRVNIQLIDATQDAHLWAEHFDRDVADTFAIETEIGDAIAHKLNAVLSPAETAAVSQPTRDMEAFDLYLRAKELITNFHDTTDWKETLLRASRLLDEAISRDGRFALAYCWSSRAHDQLYWFNLDPSPTRLSQATAAAQTALALAPDLGDAHLAQAYVHYHGRRDYPSALAELEIARLKLPNSAEVYALLGYVARRQARWDDALVNLRKAVDLDPRNPQLLSNLSILYDVLRRYDEKLALYDRSAAVQPNSRDYFQMMRAQTNLERGEIEAARSFMQSLPDGYDPDGVVTFTRFLLAFYERKLDVARQLLAGSKFTEVAANGGIQLPISWFQGCVARALGDTNGAQRAFADTRSKLEPKVREKPDDVVLLAQLAVVDAGLGRGQDAIAEAERAAELRPVSQDALDGATVLGSVAMVYAWTGNVNAAIDRLTYLAKIPGGPDYGELKYSPLWDPVRKDPRYAEMVASLKPTR